MATHSRILAWRMERGAWQNTAWSHKESDLRKTGHVAYVCKTYLYDITQKTGLKNVYVCVCVYNFNFKVLKYNLYFNCPFRSVV